MKIATAETRCRAIEAYHAKRGTQEQIAGYYGVHLRTFQRWLERYRRTGSVEPKFSTGRKPVYRGRNLQKLEECLRETPDATLEELRERTGSCGSIMAVHRAVVRMGYRLKKSHCEPASKSGPT